MFQRASECKRYTPVRAQNGRRRHRGDDTRHPSPPLAGGTVASWSARIKSRRTGRAFLESRGEGVRRILEASEAHAGRQPAYELFGEELRLTIWAKPSPHEKRADRGG